MRLRSPGTGLGSDMTGLKQCYRNLVSSLHLLDWFHLPLCIGFILIFHVGAGDGAAPARQSSSVSLFGRKWTASSWEAMHAQLCLTLCNSMDCSPLGSSVHGILQARILEWVAIPFSRGSSQPRDQTQASCIAGRYLTTWATWEAVYSNYVGSRVHPELVSWPKTSESLLGRVTVCIPGVRWLNPQPGRSVRG